MNNEQHVINHDGDYYGITMSKIIKHIDNMSQYTIYGDFDIDKLEEIINKYPMINESESVDLTVDEEIEYKSFQKTITKFYNDFVIQYNISEADNEEEENEEIDFTEDIEDIIDNLNKPKANTIYLYFNKYKINIEQFLSELKLAYIKNIKTNVFYTIGVDNYGFNLIKQNTEEFEMHLEEHYGKDFIKFNDDLISDLINKNKGLFLLHGLSGTGKSKFLSYLINFVSKHKKIIYVPSFMMEQLANPEFITFLQRNKKSILILEDAEFALRSRSDEFGAQAVSNLLNITDGLLNQAIGIQVIATFNMDKKNLDSALLRPGRLLNEWKFDKLSIEDAQNLAKFLNKDLEINEPMTVAEVYSGKVQVLNKKKKVGFKN